MSGQLPIFPNPWGDLPPPTPFYAYSEAILRQLWESFEAALAPDKMPAPLKLHFAMKSNANPHVLRFLRDRGAGIDLVSGGELRRALKLGFSPRHMVFSGVGKTREELALAVRENVASINVESSGEMDRLAEIARALNLTAQVSFRVNPDVDAKTHPYISTGLSAHKFGIPMNEATEIYAQASRTAGLRVRGVSVHIGSQMLSLEALDEALKKTLDFTRQLRVAGIPLEVLDVGGGLGVDYRNPRQAPPFAEYGRILKKASKEWAELQGPGAVLYSECGRALVAQAGALFTRVIGTKKNGGADFAIVDGSMTELLRPSLYQAWHPIDFVAGAPGSSAAKRPVKNYEVVGPVCESSDVLGRERALPELREGDIVSIGCAGAYGYVMASTYNARPLPTEWWIPESGESELSRAALDLE